MQLGFVGWRKMGMSMVEQLHCDVHEIVAFNLNNAKNPKLK
jgi:6-phosphogluconate dehydrogenase (decarboxylating)